jgi:glycosyltransferase involved in cell wall biosynthesis
MQSVCERIVVLDDHSSDGTAQYCASEGAEVLSSPFAGRDEARDKTWLLENAGLEPGDWVCLFDGDEILHPEDGGILKREILSRQYRSYVIRILFLWDRPTQVRMDGVYGRFARSGRPSIFEYRQGQSFRGPGGANYHCGSVPSQLMGTWGQSQARLLHMGYMHREDRIRKYGVYTQTDQATLAIEDGYRHMAIGDLFPADSQFRHGGPLQLCPLPSWELATV